MKKNVVGTLGLSLALVSASVSPAFAQDSGVGRTQMDARSAVQQVGMDRETALSVQRRDKLAWGIFIGGSLASGILMGTGKALAKKAESDCTSTSCTDSGSEAQPYYIGGALSLLLSTTLFLTIRPSAEMRAKAQQVLTAPDLRFRVDPKTRTAFATAHFAF